MQHDKWVFLPVDRQELIVSFLFDPSSWVSADEIATDFVVDKDEDGEGQS